MPSGRASMGGPGATSGVVTAAPGGVDGWPAMAEGAASTSTWPTLILAGLVMPFHAASSR